MLPLLRSHHARNTMGDHKDIKHKHPDFDELRFHWGDKINIHERGKKHEIVYD